MNRMTAIDEFFEIHLPIPGSGTVYEHYRNGQEAAQLEAALLKLKPRFHELTELSTDLRQTNQLPKNWEKALTESLGLSELQALGCLDSIGFPPSAGNTPPFEGTIKVKGGCLGFPSQVIPFDVKPAFGSGEEMVRFLVEDEVRSWALGLGQSVPDCVFHTSGPVLQRNPNGIGLQVQSFLAHLPAAPVYPKSFSLTVGLASICVVLEQSQSLQVDTSSFALTEKDAAVAGFLRGHLSKKAEHASRLNKPFLLIYVKPNGRGLADLKQSQVEDFTHPDVTGSHRQSRPEPNIVGSDLWLGTLFLDFCQGSNGRPKRQGWFRECAKWPTKLTGATFIEELGLEESCSRFA